jgi:2-amino-4-hydroxy-6-hydroxymethyldihydropteridine diphosphokinase
MAVDIAQWGRDDTVPLCFIGVGSNLGIGPDDPESIVKQAIEALGELSTFPVVSSSLWRSAPIDCPPDSPPYINAVVALRTPVTDAYELLRELQTIERRFGRNRSGIINEARTLDLDLLSFARVQLNDPALTLPHPRLHQRRFVLAPLCEIAPEHVLAGLGQSCGDLLLELDVNSDSQALSRIQ